MSNDLNLKKIDEREIEEREKLLESIANKDGLNGPLAAMLVAKSSVNILKDGIARVFDEKEERGYLVISPEVVKDNNRHLALKVDANKFWTISASKDGGNLEIGILKDGEFQKVISFNQNAALSLKKPLKLGGGIEYIQEDIVKGISTSGFKGFKEGKLKASSNWESTECIVPDDTFGKYKVQAWLIQQQNSELTRYSHLETVFIFFPTKKPQQVIKNQTNDLTIIKRLYYQFEEWWNTKILKKGDEYVPNPEMKAGKRNAMLKAKVDKKDQNKIKIKCETAIDPDQKLIYYTIERLWEGANWIEEHTQEDITNANEENN